MLAQEALGGPKKEFAQQGIEIPEGAGMTCEYHQHMVGKCNYDSAGITQEEKDGR